MSSSNGNIFRVSGPLFTGHRSFDVFFDLGLNKRFSKQSKRWWCETPSCSLCSHPNDTLLWEPGLSSVKHVYINAADALFPCVYQFISRRGIDCIRKVIAHLEWGRISFFHNISHIEKNLAILTFISSLWWLVVLWNIWTIWTYSMWFLCRRGWGLDYINEILSAFFPIWILSDGSMQSTNLCISH